MDKVITVGRDEVPSRISLGEGETLKMTLFIPEGVSADLSLEIDLDGKGGSLDLAGAYVCRGQEKVKLNVNVRHNVPGCRSVQLFKGIVGGSARAEFGGLVYVSHGAGQTLARQQNHTLLLSDTAFVESKPQLEIYADDVECSHGATTGYLNPDELFYMRSRGIPEEEARALQIEAFLAPITDRLKDDGRRVEGLEVESRWGDGLDVPNNMVVGNESAG